MGLDFITSNPADDAYGTALDRANKQGKLRQDIGVDTAIRSGVSDMLSAKPQPDPLTPTPAPYQSPPASPDASAPPQSPPRATGQTAFADSRPFGSPPSPTLQTATGTRESGENMDPSAINPTSGYRFRYGFGKPALFDAGIYKPSPGESLSGQTNPWTGIFNVPGFGQMNYDQFSKNGPAQDIAWTNHMANVDHVIQSTPTLNGALGKPMPGLPGVTINEDVLRSMVHAVGAGGTRDYLESGGNTDPYNVRGAISKMAGVAPGAPPGVPPNGPAGAPGYSVPQASFMPSASAQQPQFMGGTAAGTRFDPILNRLAAQPGGGTAALGLLTQQGKFDQQNYQRQTQASKLAMTALAHGDVDTAKYWATYAGIPTNTVAFQPGNNSQMFGQVGLLSQRLYGAHTPEATNFAQNYMQAIQQNGGNRADAFQTAFAKTGPAPNNPKMTLKTVTDAAGDLHLITVNAREGTATPVMNGDGTPVVGPQPTHGGAGPTTELTWVRQADGTQLGYTRSKKDGSLTPAVDPNTNQQITNSVRTPASALSFDHKVDLFQRSGMTGPEALAAASGQRPQYQIVQQNDGTFSVVNKGTAAATPVVTAGGSPVTGKLPPQTNEIFRVQQTDGSELGYTHNRQTNEFTPAIDPTTGKQFIYAAKPNAGTSTFDHKVQAWQQAGLNPTDALAAASGHPPPAVTPAIVAGLYRSSATSIDNTTLPGEKEDPSAFNQRKQQMLHDRMNDLIPNWQVYMQQRPTAPAPAAPLPQVAPVQPAPAQAAQSRPAPTPAPYRAPAAAPPQARAHTGQSAEDAIPVGGPDDVAKLNPGTWFIPPDNIPRKVRLPPANVQ